MEVHHHSHTSRKKWTHYFWEFLMLFLAVFCGFLAEYQLEHKIEKDREEVYMSSMIEDLKSDTAQFNLNISLRTQRVNMIDSLAYLLSLPDYKSHMNDIYFYGRYISPPINVFPNDRTIQQLKSSGGLRLIRKPAVSNNIMAYDQKMRLHIFQLGDEQEMRSEYRVLAQEVFDGKVFYKMLQNNIVNRPKDNPSLFKADAQTINRLIIAIQYFKKADEVQIDRANELNKQAIELISLIKKEYILQ